MEPLTPVTSPTDIERAIEQFIVPRIEALKKTARQQNMRYVFANPALTVAVYDGKLETLGPVKFLCHCPVHVEVRFSNAASEEARRDGINPLVFAVIAGLARQKMGLAIKGLLPRGFKDVTSEEDYKNNLIVYDIEFATTFTLEITDEEDAGDLLGLAMQYFLKPGDAVVDAEDDVTVEHS